LSPPGLPVEGAEHETGRETVSCFATTAPPLHPSSFFRFHPNSLTSRIKTVFSGNVEKSAFYLLYKTATPGKANKHPGDPMSPVQKQTVKIAVPLFKDRVGPHFGASSTFLLAETDGATISGETTWDLPGEGPMDIARRLVDLGVNLLICGGIPSHYKDWLMGKGMTVVDNQKGRVRGCRGAVPKKADSGENDRSTVY
jgi:predicted Fe-Mo cluster-binding NifX family protein